MNSIYILSLLAVGFLYCVEAQQSKPSFCRRSDCPLFTTVSSNSDYEHRSYQPSKWVSTRVLGGTHRQAGSTSFNKLFAYISRGNEENMKMDMTVPVIAKVIPTGDGEGMNADYTYSFFIPFEHQENTPAPSSDDVFLEEMPAFEAYVRDFGGWAYESDYISNARLLKADLDRDNVDYDDSFYYTVGYDSPFRWFFRRNEVWILKRTPTA
ncbi:heme-binding protein 2-like [Apostichopus japonicus]|uniref:heme-binding protein 2-like n=1 Tax=Stichopus japonicus TaxID=307972 RepID=UPI003AB2E1FB